VTRKTGWLGCVGGASGEKHSVVNGATTTEQKKGGGTGKGREQEKGTKEIRRTGGDTA